MSKGSITELIRSNPDKFENIVADMHFTEKNVVYGELHRRAEILGGPLNG